MSYTAFRVVYVGVPRDHHAIFIETQDDGSGQLYQVIGDIQTGMTFQEKPGRKPEESVTYQGKIRIGTVTHEAYPRVAQICQGVTPPKKQFDVSKRLYPAEPLRRCQEWTEEAIQALLAALRLHYAMRNGWDEDIEIAEEAPYAQLVYDPLWQKGAAPQLPKQIMVLVAAFSGSIDRMDAAFEIGCSKNKVSPTGGGNLITWRHHGKNRSTFNGRSRYYHV